MSELKEALINISEEVRTKIIPENIKAGVQIFNTEGNFLGDALDTSDATATASDILKDKTAYVNGEKVTGTLEARGYNAKIKTPTATFAAFFNLIEELDLSDVDFSVTTSMKNLFINYTGLKTIKGMNTGHVTNMYGMFSGCSALVNFAPLNTSKVLYMTGMFTNCTKLSNESLNNILKMCIDAVSYSGTKTLASIGLTEAQATICTTLSNHQAFLDAGWVTGY